MRIALVTHKVGPQDGQGRVNYEIAKAVLARGDQLTILGETCASDVANHPNGRFVRLLDRHLPTQMARDQYFAARSARWLRRHRAQFDLVQANGFVTWEPADIVAVHYVHSAWLANPHYPFRWSSFSPYAYYQRLNTILNGYLEKRAFRSSRKIVAVSGTTARDVESLGVAPEKVEVVYNGVDTDEFAPGPPLRNEFQLREEVPLALFIGDIRTPRKNLDTVLKAMNEVPELYLVVAGDVQGSPYPLMAEKLGIGPRVSFIGKTSRIAALMRSVDFFVFPSRYEAHPLVLMEALATGTPVVVSNNFGAQDYVGNAGIIFGGPDDKEALVIALRRMLTETESWRAMSEAGRNIALRMQWSQTAAGYLKIYDEVVGRKAANQDRAHTLGARP